MLFQLDEHPKMNERISLSMKFINWPDGTSAKTSTSGTGGMEFKYPANQISHTLPTTCHHCNFDVWALAQNHSDG